MAEPRHQKSTEEVLSWPAFLFLLACVCSFCLAFLALATFGVVTLVRLIVSIV